MTTSIEKVRAGQLLLVLLGLAFLWPAIVNRAPFLFPDTTSYVRAADAIVLRAAGYQTVWSNADVRQIAADTGSKPQAPIAASPGSAEPKPVLLGRSVYYGALAYLGAAAGQFWGTIVLQALFASWVLFGLVRHIISPAHARAFAVTYGSIVAAAALTPLPFFTSMVMPDVFAGTAVIAGAVLIAGWQRETRWGRIGWTVAAGYSALVHSSHVLILAAMAVVGLLIGISTGWTRRHGAIVTLVAALIGLAGEMAFASSVKSMTGVAPIRPPFITARLVEDGPGTHYLDSHCGAPTFYLCRFRDRLPIPSDDFLWRTDNKGVFKAGTVAEQRRLAAEQSRFVGLVIADRPLAVLGSTLRAIGRQFRAWRLPEFNWESGYADEFADRLPPDERATFLRSASYRGAMPTQFVTMLVPVWTIIGIAVFASSLWRRRTGARRLYMSMLVVGWVCNIAICGALSTPHDRYQARVLWLMALMPFLAFVRPPSANTVAAPRRAA